MPKKIGGKHQKTQHQFYAQFSKYEIKRRLLKQISGIPELGKFMKKSYNFSRITNGIVKMWVCPQVMQTTLMQKVKTFFSDKITTVLSNAFHIISSLLSLMWLLSSWCRKSIGKRTSPTNANQCMKIIDVSNMTCLTQQKLNLLFCRQQHFHVHHKPAFCS